MCRRVEYAENPVRSRALIGRGFEFGSRLKLRKTEYQNAVKVFNDKKIVVGLE